MSTDRTIRVQLLRQWMADAEAAIPVTASDGFRLGARGVLDGLSEALDKGDADTDTLPISDCFRHGEYVGFQCPQCGPAPQP